MPFKCANGIWRHDQPGGNNGPMLVTCPNCGGYLDQDRILEDDEFDVELAADWGLYSRYDNGMSNSEAARLEDFLHCSCAYAVCEDCDLAYAYGADYYWNPATAAYDLPRPLTKAKAEKAELEHERMRQDAAGQMPLFT